MKTPAIHALNPMLEALRIKQAVSFDDCLALFAELREKTGATPPAFELSGNQWCALVNLALARHEEAPPKAQPMSGDEIRKARTSIPDSIESDDPPAAWDFRMGVRADERHHKIGD